MFARIFTIALTCLLLSVLVLDQTSWPGSYEFSENGGKTAGGTPIVVSHHLEVVDSGNGLVAILKSNGYQTSIDLLCAAKLDGAKLLIYFDSYGEDNLFEPYKKGDLLLTLERKGKTAILTHWGKLTPSVSRNEKSGKVYFVRSHLNKIETR